MKTLKIFAVMLSMLFVVSCASVKDNTAIAVGKLEAPHELKITKKITPPAKEKVAAVVRFAFDSNYLSRSGKVMMDIIAQVMRDNPEMKLEIRGFASTEGSAIYNKGLARRRVDAIKVELMQRGIKGTRMTTEAVGETGSFGSKLEDNRIVTITSIS